MKKCITCGKEKKEIEENFYWRNDNKKFGNKCKVCVEKDAKQYRQKNKEEISKYQKQYQQEHKEEISEYQKQYKQDYKEEIREYKLEYYQENKEEILEDKKKYNKEHKDERNEYQRNRRKNDPIYKLHKDMSRAIYNNLKDNNLTKNNKTTNELLPYTMEELKEHLENHHQIEDWMRDKNGNLDWSKRGKYNPETHEDNPTWQIDHEIPKSKFNIEKKGDEEFQKCWGLDNLRPYCAKKNIKEGNRR